MVAYIETRDGAEPVAADATAEGRAKIRRAQGASTWSVRITGPPDAVEEFGERLSEGWVKRDR